LIVPYENPTIQQLSEEYPSAEEVVEKPEDTNKMKGVLFLTKEFAWMFTKLSGEYNMKRISLINTQEEQNVMKLKYDNYDLQTK
jgi:hypothetical protein